MTHTGSPVVGLDDQITNTFSVLSLLIAIVAAYLAAVWPVIAALLNGFTPEEQDDREALVGISVDSSGVWLLPDGGVAEVKATGGVEGLFGGA